MNAKATGRRKEKRKKNTICWSVGKLKTCMKLITHVKICEIKSLLIITQNKLLYYQLWLTFHKNNNVGIPNQWIELHADMIPLYTTFL